MRFCNGEVHSETRDRALIGKSTYEAASERPPRDDLYIEQCPKVALSVQVEGSYRDAFRADMEA